MTAKERMARWRSDPANRTMERERAKARYHARPEVRERANACKRAARTKPEARALAAAYFRRRYHTDPEFRAKSLARNVAYARKRYRLDPEWRAKKQAYNRARRARQKAAQ